MKIERAWSMPSGDTFSLPPIADLLKRWLPAGVIVDPFARNSRYGTIRNDLNPNTDAEHHEDAVAFLERIKDTRADAVLFDPPYSPRQISELYQSIGRPCGSEDTQNARLYKAVKDRLAAILRPGGIAISCGWNSSGFGKTRGFLIEEILIVCHGAAHNDTICTVERRV